MSLLILYILLIFFIVLFSKGFIVKTWFLFTGIYTSITFGVYSFAPDLFSLINVEVTGVHREQIGYFLILSVIANYFFYLLFSLSNKNTSIIDLKKVNKGDSSSFIFFYCALSAYILSYFFLNQDAFNWGDGSNSLGSPLFAISYRVFIAGTVLLIGYNLIEKRKNALLYRILILIGTWTVFAVAVKASSRSDIIYFIVALAILFISYYKISNAKLIVLSMFLIPSIIFFSQLMLLNRSVLTNASFFETYDLITSTIFLFDQESLILFISQDYFSPAATLIMSFEKEIIIPSQVIISNFLNSFYLIGGDTISSLVVSEYGLTFDRGAGFAYLLYAEGYNLMGFSGFIYNGFIGGFFLYILNAGLKGVSGNHLIILKAILAILLLQIIRTQSGSGFKLIYTLLPILYFYCKIFGYNLRFFIKKHR